MREQLRVRDAELLVLLGGLLARVRERHLPREYAHTGLYRLSEPRLQTRPSAVETEVTGSEDGVVDLASFLSAHSCWASAGLQSYQVRVMHQCGHEDIVHVLLMDDLDPLKLNLCGSCASAAEEDFRARTEAAILRADELGLPALIGKSDRQVAYGALVRDKAIAFHGDKKIGYALENRLEAKWWIDNRSRIRGMALFREAEDGLV